MAVKIRLARRGRKKMAMYDVVVADARAPRDGRFIEKIGTYNPLTNPATIDLLDDRAFHWVMNGAQPTDTVRAILSYKGVLLKHHLAGGVRKGALTEEQAEAKFNAWLQEKANAVDNKRSGLSKPKEKAKAEALAAEKAVSEKRAADAAAALVEAVAEETTEEVVEAVEASADETVAEVTEATTTEEVVAEEAAPEATEPEAEATEEKE